MSPPLAPDGNQLFPFHNGRTDTLTTKPHHYVRFFYEKFLSELTSLQRSAEKASGKGLACCSTCSGQGERRGAERGSGTQQATTLSKQRLSESHTFQVKSYTTAIHYNSQKSTSGLLLALPLAFPRLRFGVFIFLARQTSVSDVDQEREEDEAGELNS